MDADPTVWDDTVEGYYDWAEETPGIPAPRDYHYNPPEETKPAAPRIPEPSPGDLDMYRSICKELWDEYRATWCECPLCVEAHKPRPGVKRDPVTGHGCPIGSAQWKHHQAGLSKAREWLPHGHPETYRQGCRCEPCTAARAQRKVPAGAAHGLETYRRYACLCDICRAASALYRKNLRAARAAENKSVIETLEALVAKQEEALALYRALAAEKSG